jgi:[amino group carrier protein]-L-2-aminoadipate 6-kinase
MIIIKIGGGEKINIRGIVSGLSQLNDDFIIVHGANHLRDSIMHQMGASKKIITSASGYDSVFSDEKMIDIMMMAYAGVKNKRIVELCQQNGINAVGLSGVDGRCIQGLRNKGIRTYENGCLKITRDFSGKPSQINTKLIELLLSNGFVPVLCVPIIDENGFAINSENDDIVTLLQSAFKASKVISLIEEEGLLDENGVLIKKLSAAELDSAESKYSGRIKRKLLAIKKLFLNGVTTMIICDGRTESPIADALSGAGTEIS